MAELPEALREHLARPRGAGEPPAGVAAGRGEGANAACGDVLLLALWREEGRLRAGFRASACSGVLACASLLCERIEATGRLEGLDLAGEVERRGGLPRQRAHSVRVCERALEQAVRALAQADS